MLARFVAAERPVPAAAVRVLNNSLLIALITAVERVVLGTAAPPPLAVPLSAC